MKTHYAKLATGSTACHRPGRRTTDNVFRVDCALCMGKPEFLAAQKVAIEAREAAFHAQTPRTVVPQFGRVNDDGVMECPTCTGVLWRERPRSLFSYHYVCSECGNSVHPMTETGMCT